MIQALKEMVSSAEAGAEGWTLCDRPEVWDLAQNWSIIPERWKSQLTEDGRPKNGPTLEVLPIKLSRQTKLSSTNGRLLFRGCYADLFERAEAISKDVDSGIVITGQPGTGKTFWLWYAAMRLVKKGHPVILAYGHELTLFFKDQVYQARVEELMTKYYPSHPNPTMRPWILVDWDLGNGLPAQQLLQADAFVILASSPNPSRYRSWLKQRSLACLWGMPLWTHEELLKSLLLHAACARFFKQVEEAITANQIPTSNVMKAAFEALLPGGAASPQSIVQPLSREVILKKLVDHAVKKYGNSLRDVSTAIFYGPDIIERDIKASLPWLTPSHLTFALDINYPDVHNQNQLVYDLVQIHVERLSGSLSLDKFVPEFKSHYIAGRAMEYQDRIDYLAAKQLLRECRRTLLGSSTFAGWIFETLAHKLLSGNQPVRGGILKVFNMNSVPSCSTTFVSEGKQSPMRMHVQERGIDFFILGQVDSEFPDLGSYYIPRTHNHPFFSSFLIETNSDSTVLWIFQCTLGEAHASSEKAYDEIKYIRELVGSTAAKAMDPGKEDGPIVKKAKLSKEVEIRYALVCPEDSFFKEPRKWTIPWKAAEGEVVCIPLDVSHF